jgi:hypothetical protein
MITNPTVSVPFVFAWLNAFQAAVTHSHKKLQKVLIEIYCIKKCLLDLDPI